MNSAVRDEKQKLERLTLTLPRVTANGKNEFLQSVFSSLNSRVKIFVFVANCGRHFSMVDVI